jgi:serine protease Do
MKKNVGITAAGLAVLVPVLIALPSHSSARRQQERADTVRTVEIVQDPGTITIVKDEEGPSWLGVEAREVTPENVKELKLPAERGIVVGRVAPESPASKAGLKENDVVTELSGQRVEGAAQFRRMIREIPAGRTVQLTVFRDGHTQSVSVTLGQAEERHRDQMGPLPGSFSFHMPEVEVPEIADLPPMELDNMMVLPIGRPRLGIDAEDVSGQLGNYFGVPEGEGVLVRSVNAGSVAERAGVKAGDVITKFNGDRIRSLGDLREKLAATTDGKTAKLSVLRNKNEVTLIVELPPPAQKVKRRMGHSTNI